MQNMTKRVFVIGLVIGVFALATCSVQAAKVKTEDELIALLGSAKEKEVINAMQEMEKHYPTSAKCQAALNRAASRKQIPISKASENRFSLTPAQGKARRAPKEQI